MKLMLEGWLFEEYPDNRQKTDSHSTSEVLFQVMCMYPYKVDHNCHMLSIYV
jgi:hypothetical protein